MPSDEITHRLCLLRDSAGGLLMHLGARSKLVDASQTGLANKYQCPPPSFLQLAIQSSSFTLSIVPYSRQHE